MVMGDLNILASNQSHLLGEASGRNNTYFCKIHSLGQSSPCSVAPREERAEEFIRRTRQDPISADQRALHTSLQPEFMI